jgi:hypothetical protein
MHQYAYIYLLQRQTLHVSGVTAPILRSSKNCICYLWYRSWCEIQVRINVAVNKCVRTDASSWSFLLILNHDARNHEFKILMNLETALSRD